MFPKRENNKNFIRMHIDGLKNIDNCDLFKHYYRYLQ